MLFFKQGLIALFSGSAAWNSPSLKAILLSSYTYDSTHQFVSDIAASELTGYDRPDVSASVIYNDSEDRLELRFVDTTITAVADAQTVGAFALFIEGDDDTDSDLIAYQTGVAEATNGGAITLNAPPNSLGPDNFVFAVARGGV